MIKEKIADTKLEIMSEIANRWSARGFSEKAVEEEKLQRVFEAARWAPSSRNEQPWRFIVAQKGDEHYDKLFNGLDDGNKRWAWTAPVLVASITKLKFDYKGYTNGHALHDLGLAMGALLVQATHEGLQVHQMGGIHPEVITDGFGINAKDYKVVTMFVIGYQDESRLSGIPERDQESEYEPRKRRPLSETISGSVWGKTPEWAAKVD